MIRISVYYDGNSVSEFEQEDSKEITIGRASGCSIHLEEASISRLHALIRYENGQWILERKASFGAVLLNGAEVENAPLEGGEEISIGKFSLRVNIEGAVEASSSSSFSLAQSGDEGDGRTKQVSTGVNGFFRFEPGTASVTEFLMEADVAVFGRGSNCDVILTEKKASRKHCEIRKEGLSFFAKDLNSSNGTQVNGSSISEVELVPGDVISIGECKIQFSIENKDYFNKQDQFLPVPAHLENTGLDAYPAGAQEYGDPMQPNIPGMDSSAQSSSASVEEEEPKSLTGKLRKRYMSMTFRQRLIFIGIAFAFIVALFGGPDDNTKKPVRKVVPGSKNGRSFEALTPAKQKEVKKLYEELLKAQAQKDYNSVRDLFAKIFVYVDDYHEAKSYENIAIKNLAEIEEAKRRRELQEKQEKVRKEVQALEEKGKELFEKSLNDPKYRPELDALIQEIYSKDPNHRLSGEWKVKIKEKDEEDKKQAELARLKEQTRQKAEDAFAEVEKIFKAERYIEALKEADKLTEQGYDEKSYLDRIESLKNNIRVQLASVLEPHLKEASAQRQEGGDLVKAKEEYLKVLKIDSTNIEAQSGLDSIRETLHTRAKRYYAEAILAESVSDLTEAKDKYEKCFRTAPDEDLYKKRCRNKLARFDSFAPVGGGG